MSDEILPMPRIPAGLRETATIIHRLILTDLPSGFREIFFQGGLDFGELSIHWVLCDNYLGR
jgi:hypothetical protein